MKYLRNAAYHLKNRQYMLLIKKALKKMGLLPLAKRLLPEKLKGRLRNQVASEAVQMPLAAYERLEQDIEAFINRVDQQQKVWMVISGVEYVDHEGQRNIRLIHEAMLKGIKVIFVYFRWNREDPIPQPTESMIQIPLDYLYENRNSFFQNCLVNLDHKAMIVEFPHPYAEELIQIANCFGWISIYDVIDDWREFSLKGQAVWYDKKVEERVVNSVDISVATAKRLEEKVNTGDNKKYIITNGVDPGRIQPSARLPEFDFRKGNLQIGYFGHLTDAWFDWDLIKKLADKNKDWTFHIIGYGAPENLKVPKNIILYGKKKPEELAKYAAYWDVAIIPFINCELTLSVNPIKIYEYLQLKLPVVASNMPEIANAPYTQIAIGAEEFEAAIRKAKDLVMDDDLISEYVNKNTWACKCEAFIEAIESFNIADSYKSLL